MLIVKDVLTRNLITASEDTPVRDLAALMSDKCIGSVFITNAAGETTGIVTESDIVRKVVAGDRVPYVTKAVEIMSSPIISIDINENIYQAHELMDKKHVLHLAVTEEGKIAGLVSVRDLIHPYEHFERGSSWV